MTLALTSVEKYLLDIKPTVRFSQIFSTTVVYVLCQVFSILCVNNSCCNHHFHSLPARKVFTHFLLFWIFFTNFFLDFLFFKLVFFFTKTLEVFGFFFKLIYWDFIWGYGMREG